MTNDRYTKVVLTIIALCLLAISYHLYFRTTDVHDSYPSACGDAGAPCNIVGTVRITQ